LQLHDLQARFFKLVPDVVEPIAHIAIVLDESQYDLLDRTNGFMSRQALVVAIESLGKAFAVSQMGLQHLCHLAQNPVDLFILVGRLSPRLGLAPALGRRRRRLDRQTAEPNADPAEQQKLKERTFARDQGPERGKRLIRNNGSQRGQRDSAKEDGDESVGRVGMPSDELHDFHDRADPVGKSARERRGVGLASTPEETRRTDSYSV
jgi:hypothetical protein